MELLKSLGIQSQGVMKRQPKDSPDTLTVFPLQKSFSGLQNYFAQSFLQPKEKRNYYHAYNNYNATSSNIHKHTSQLIRHFRPKNFCSKKFSVKMFFYLLELSIANAEILLSITHDKKSRISKEFRLFIAKSFLKENCVRPKVRSILNERQVTLSQTHMPNKEKRRGFCDFCKKSKVNSFCTHCRTFLCIKDCFQEYHMKIFKIYEDCQSCEQESVMKEEENLLE
jgi:hypothetical protein